MTIRALLPTIATVLLLTLAGCASKPSTPRGGGYYKQDGPANVTPDNLDRIPDAIPQAEPLHRFTNRPYNVFGVNYTPMTSLSPFTQQGTASWYGRMFHGKKTANGEIYDMFAMTAAHPTLPLPSYARITHADNGRSVIVRVNDRGPFHPGRIVDLSYAAAHRLGIVQSGSARVRLELLLPPFESTANTSVTPTAVPVAPISEPTPLAPDQVNSGTFFVQLGAFGNFANAQVFQQRLSTELSETPRIRQVNSLFRVQLGPYATRASAQAALERAQSTLGTTLIITTADSQ